MDATKDPQQVAKDLAARMALMADLGSARRENIVTTDVHYQAPVDVGEEESRRASAKSGTEQHSFATTNREALTEWGNIAEHGTIEGEDLGVGQTHRSRLRQSLAFSKPTFPTKDSKNNRAKTKVGKKPLASRDPNSHSSANNAPKGPGTPKAIGKPMPQTTPANPDLKRGCTSVECNAPPVNLQPVASQNIAKNKPRDSFIAANNNYAIGLADPGTFMDIARGMFNRRLEVTQAAAADTKASGAQANAASSIVEAPLVVAPHATEAQSPADLQQDRPSLPMVDTSVNIEDLENAATSAATSSVGKSHFSDLEGLNFTPTAPSSPCVQGDAPNQAETASAAEARLVSVQETQCAIMENILADTRSALHDIHLIPNTFINHRMAKLRSELSTAITQLLHALNGLQTERIEPNTSGTGFHGAPEHSENPVNTQGNVQDKTIVDDAPVPVCKASLATSGGDTPKLSEYQDSTASNVTTGLLSQLSHVQQASDDKVVSRLGGLPQYRHAIVGTGNKVPRAELVHDSLLPDASHSLIGDHELPESRARSSGAFNDNFKVGKTDIVSPSQRAKTTVNKARTEVAKIPNTNIPDNAITRQYLKVEFVSELSSSAATAVGNIGAAIVANRTTADRDATASRSQKAQTVTIEHPKVQMIPGTNVPDNVVDRQYLHLPLEDSTKASVGGSTTGERQVPGNDSTPSKVVQQKAPLIIVTAEGEVPTDDLIDLEKTPPPVSASSSMESAFNSSRYSLQPITVTASATGPGVDPCCDEKAVVAPAAPANSSRGVGEELSWYPAAAYSSQHSTPEARPRSSLLSGDSIHAAQPDNHQPGLGLSGDSIHAVHPDNRQPGLEAFHNAAGGKSDSAPQAALTSVTKSGLTDSASFGGSLIHDLEPVSAGGVHTVRPESDNRARGGSSMVSQGQVVSENHPSGSQTSTTPPGQTPAPAGGSRWAANASSGLTERTANDNNRTTGTSNLTNAHDTEWNSLFATYGRQRTRRARGRVPAFIQSSASQQDPGAAARAQYSSTGIGKPRTNK